MTENYVLEHYQFTCTTLYVATLTQGDDMDVRIPLCQPLKFLWVKDTLWITVIIIKWRPLVSLRCTT